jgi:DNA topoisomerase VI subunit B
MPERLALPTKRTTENFTESGLRPRTGQNPTVWGRYCLKELLDNALEANADIEDDDPLSIEVDLVTSSLTNVEQIVVSDNGPGIDEPDLRHIFEDIEYFSGTKRLYSLPTRGNQGNALMTIFGIQYLCDGPLWVTSNGTVYRISAEWNVFKGEHESTVEKTDADPPYPHRDVSEKGGGVAADGSGQVSSDTSGLTVAISFGAKEAKYSNSVSKLRDVFQKFVALNPQTEFTLRLHEEGDDTPTVDTYPAVAHPTVETITLRGQKQRCVGG